VNLGINLACGFPKNGRLLSASSTPKRATQKVTPSHRTLAPLPLPIRWGVGRDERSFDVQFWSSVFVVPAILSRYTSPHPATRTRKYARTTTPASPPPTSVAPHNTSIPARFHPATTSHPPLTAPFSLTPRFSEVERRLGHTPTVSTVFLTLPVFHHSHHSHLSHHSNQLTIPRTAHARAVRAIVPSAPRGNISSSFRDKFARRSASSDATYAGAGPVPPRKGCQ
jgi:hypothetical protein